MTWDLVHTEYLTPGEHPSPCASFYPVLISYSWSKECSAFGQEPTRVNPQECLSEWTPGGQGLEAPTRSGATTTTSEVGHSFACLSPKTPEMESTQLHQTTHSWSASPCRGILFLMCNLKQSACNLPFAVSSDMTENNLPLFVATLAAPLSQPLR